MVEDVGEAVDEAIDITGNCDGVGWDGKAVKEKKNELCLTAVGDPEFFDVVEEKTTEDCSGLVEDVGEAVDEAIDITGNCDGVGWDGKAVKEKKNELCLTAVGDPEFFDVVGEKTTEDCSGLVEDVGEAVDEAIDITGNCDGVGWDGKAVKKKRNDRQVKQMLFS